MACGVCGGPLSEAFRAVDRNRRISDVTFTYYRCARCGTSQLLPVPDDLVRYYPHDYYAVPTDRAVPQDVIDRERYKLGIVRQFVPRGRLIEIGTGFGAFLSIMSEAGFECSGIEMDAQSAAFVQSVVGVPVHQSDDPAALLASQGPFDVVAMWHVIEHLPNPRDVLEAIAGALNPGGVVALAAPNPASLQFRLMRANWAHLDAPRHLMLIPTGALIALGRELGLEPALVTTVDDGALGLNTFGWRESLAGFSTRYLPRELLRLAGSGVAAAMGPVERRGLRGSTYTVVLRRPDV